MKNKFILFLSTILISGVSLFPTNTYADEDEFMEDQQREYERQYIAGQVKNRDDSTTAPKAEIKPLNITGFFDTQTAKEASESTNEEDIYFSADEMINDNKEQTITALGNVNIIRNDITIVADKVTYNQVTDVVTASGNVIIVEESGNVAFSDYVELTDKMSKGFMDNVKVTMADETKVTAKKFRRLANNNKEMEDATYTPCDACENSSPLWQLSAFDVTHDAESQNVIYNNAFLELKGIPVLYTPYFSHPDPSVKRRSGFLFPNLSSTSYLGQSITPKYYWSIDEHQDFLFSPTFTTDRGILWGGTYRKYLEHGYMETSGTYINAEVRNKNYKRLNLPEYGEKKDRGNLYFKGRYEINDKWVGNADLKYVSDKDYLKDISLPQKDDMWLTSHIGAQMFENRDYADISAYYYKLISTIGLPNNEEKPFVMPVMTYENISDSNSYGAYFKNTFNMASVYREDAASDQRLTMINSWNLPYTSPYGEKYKFVASVKSDLYYIDNYVNEEGDDFTGTVARVFPQIGVEWRLPFVKATETSRQIIEPVVVAALSPNGGNKDNKIPNEDSQDIELDDTNILSLDRYAGYDRNDSGSRISYGINWSAYGDRMGRTSAFIAQSYRFNKSEGFGEYLDQRSYFSDYVGRINATPNEYLDLNYRFTIDKDTFNFNYNELTAGIGPNMMRLYISYIYLQNNKNATIQGYRERQELYTALNIGLSRDWTLRLYNRQDLAEIDKSLEYGGSVIYEDECMKFILNLERYNYDTPDYDDDYEYTATFMFKTLGMIGSE